MLFSTPSQFAVLALLLLTGWLFGFASHPGGKRWRRAYEDEAVGRARDRDELDAQLRTSDTRIAALEQEKASLAARNADLVADMDRYGSAPAPVAAPVAVTSAPVIAAPTAAPAVAAPSAIREETPVVAVPAEPQVAVAEPAPVEAAPLPIKRGWSDWGRSDDLTALRGIDAGLAERLKAEGVDKYAELGNLSDQEEIALERRLDLPAGYLMKEQLREQARLLADGQREEHASRFG